MRAVRSPAPVDPRSALRRALGPVHGAPRAARRRAPGAPLLLAGALGALLPACDADAVRKPQSALKPGGGGEVAAGPVRVLSPANGDAVEATFPVEVEVDPEVVRISIRADGETVAREMVPYRESVFTLMVTLPEGRQELSVEALGEDGEALGSYALTVQVVGEQPWVTLTSPRDGSTVRNPVRFTVNAADDVEEVELLADGRAIGSVQPGGVLTHTFSGDGLEHEVEARAWVDGEVVATDDITITVDAASTPTESDFPALMLDILETYPTDGSYAYWWPDDVDWGGNPSDIYYTGRLFAEGDPRNRSYCVGMTFEVFMRAFEIVDDETAGDGTLNEVPFAELYELRTDWYVRELYGRGIVDAMENYGFGSEVSDWDQIQPGDILQFWRHSGSGHNAIFIDWEYSSRGEIVGFTYWSTQGSTDGIGYNDEYFGSSGSSVDPTFFFAGRPAMPWDWSPWR